MKELIEWLKSQGVARFKSADFEVAFFPSKSQPAVDDMPPIDIGEPEKCPCGHDETDHNAGGECLRGCDSGACDA